MRSKLKVKISRNTFIKAIRKSVYESKELYLWKTTHPFILPKNL